MTINFKKILQTLGVLAIVAVAAVITVVAIQNPNPIIGTWYDRSSGLNVEFVSSTTVIWSDPNWEGAAKSVQGTYTITDDDTINLNFPGVPSISISKIGGTTWSYYINGDTMTLHAGKYSYTLQKEK